MANIQTARRSGLVLRGNRNVRETLWASGVAVTSNLTAAGQASNLTLLSSVGLALRPFTVVRSRGIIQISSDQLIATEFVDAGYGHAVVSEQASAIGVTAMPTPTTDSGSDLWLVYERMFLEFAFITAAGFDARGGRILRFDSKAMRKVQDGEQLVTVVEAGSLSNGFNVTVHFRMLLKLH